MDPHDKKGHLIFKIRIGLAFKVEKIWLGKIFLFDFSPNWTILSHLAKVFFSAFFGLLRPLKATKAKKAKILLSKCIKTDCLSE